EQAPGAGADGLRVVRVDAVRAEQHRVRARGVRAAYDRARVTGVANIGADRDEARRGCEQLVDREVHEPTMRHDTLRGDGVGQRGDDRFVHDRCGDRVTGEVATVRVVDGEHLDHRLGPSQSLAYRLRALDQELATFLTIRTGAEPTEPLDPTRGRCQGLRTRHP